ncbi:MAG TPA: ComEC/Rec2 family competence protein [Candidatus Saccharimonadales bacterium]|nr:ComEC/Rec2 family competence protein [Candidatus Saccharimonadales bacterium]
MLRFKKRDAWLAGALAVIGLLLGIWRGGGYLHELQPYHSLALQKVTFTAMANIDAVYGTNSQLSFVVRDVQFMRPQNVRVPGTVKVSGFGETMVYRGDQLEVSGKLYPTRGANQATVSFAQLRKLGASPSTMDTVRRGFAAGMQSALPEPLASFGLGLLVGQRNTLPAALTQALLMVGLTHIIAVSGYNLTILLQAARRLLGERSKLLSTIAALVLIGSFLLIAGTSASIVRAAVISVLTLSAWYYGRNVRPLLLILLAAAGTACANPVYVWADISWYLSFLAFFGILLIAPLLIHALYGDKQPHLLVQIAIESLCAEIMTMPLVLYIFGQVSLVSLLANLLVVALIPLAMLLSLVAGLAGMLAGNIAGWLAWPAQVLLSYMLDVVNLLSRIPRVFQQNRYLSTIDMALSYAFVVAILALAYWRKKKRAQFTYHVKTQPSVS